MQSGFVARAGADGRPPGPLPPRVLEFPRRSRQKPRRIAGLYEGIVLPLPIVTTAPRAVIAPYTSPMVSRARAAYVSSVRRLQVSGETLVAIVDDDESVRDTTRDLLRSAGFSGRCSRLPRASWSPPSSRAPPASSPTCACRACRTPAPRAPRCLEPSDPDDRHHGLRGRARARAGPRVESGLLPRQAVLRGGAARLHPQRDRRGGRRG